MRNFIKYYLPVLLSISLLTISCQKEPADFKAAKGDYFPTSTGSEWNYLVTSAFETSSRAPVQKITGDTAIENFTYSTLITSTRVSEVFSDTNVLFVRKENGNYYARHPVYTGFTNSGEYIFLKDNVKKGSKWIHKISENFEKEYTVSVIDQQRKIEGITYDSIIEITENEYALENGRKIISTTRNVYAKDIGLVLREFEAYIYKSFSTRTLKHFNIK